ncbi:Kelch-like protein 3 [Clonorchis sinensis]|uniref:Kelch-like protein 3 n=1 Tax=Clonorchis sinensis TaxID=79923 RepID=A0A8T1ME88_CLOSI|nr:Kelch-like protein 3 [Clonorchis sinensis]
MFANPVLESCSECVVINDVDEGALVQLVNFLYTGELFLNEETVEALLLASDLLQISPARDACCRFLQSQLHPENCLGISRFAKWHNCTKLWESSMRFVCEHFAEVLGSCDEFMQLSADDMEQLVASDRLTVSEDRIFEAVLRWIEYDMDKRRQNAKRLLNHVRFGLLSRAHVVRLNTSSEFEIARSWCEERLRQALIYHLSPSDGRKIMAKDQFEPRAGMRELLLVIAGWNGADIPSVECFDFRTGLWKSESGDSGESSGIPDLPRERSFMGVALFQEQVYVIGGCVQNESVRFVDIYDICSNSWSVGPDLRCKRDEVGVATLGGKLYAIGGLSDNKALSSAEVLNDPSGTWSFITSMSCSRRRVGVAVLGGRIYAIGGENTQGFLSSGEYYDPISNVWTMIADMGFPRCWLSACALNNRIYVVGGKTGSNAFTSDVEFYNPETNNWTGTTELNVARGSAGIVAHNGLLYVIGGMLEGTYLASVEAYDPHTEMWTLLPEEMNRSRSGLGAVMI